MGTMQQILAGAGIAGESDVVLWDSSMTEKDARAQDLFHRQALMSGAHGEGRVPILLDMGGGKATLDKLRGEVGARVGGVLGTVGVLGGGPYPKFKNNTDGQDKVSKVSKS